MKEHDKNVETKASASLFTRSESLIESDPLEEIFALNLGDFLTEHLISEDLAQKINKHDILDKAEGLKKQLRELISIYSIDNTLSVLGFNSKDDYIIYNSIAKTIIQMLEVDACHIFLSKENAKGLSKNDNDLVLVGSSVNFDDDIYSYNIGYKFSDDAFAVMAFEEQRTVKAEIVPGTPHFKPILKLDEGKVKSYIAIPMHNNAETVGVIVIESYSKVELENEYLSLIEVTSKIFATSMVLQKLTEETSRVLEDENVSKAELQHLRAELTVIIGDLGDEQQKFVENLAKAVDLKGEYKDYHSENIANLAKELCDELELNEKTKDLIYYAGLLQNIGKITLPKELFSKKEKLSKADWESIQNHPNVGVNLLMNINFLSEVIPYIHYHRERWDGKGEPEGLKGFSIPLGSRIIAVADAYSALTSDRAYRKALSNNEALEIIKKETGEKWDPAVVDALLRLKN